jgi:DNA-nicking Smr family endonuclease
MTRRRLSDDERALWKGFARAVTPLRRDESGGDADESDSALHQAGRETALPRAGSGRGVSKPQQPAALAPFDRRLRARLARGHTAIDARLDLHGMTQQQAHAALLRFLHQAQTKDVRLALIVTGKGIGKAAAGSERGVLRRQVPLWLGLPEFRRFVVSFQEAHLSHGGEGALYLRLRRRAR